jgi:hypothetical protein
MTKKALLFLLTVFISDFSYGQDELQLYKKIYQTADSLKKTGHILDFDNSVFKIASKLDKQHPSKFFEASGELLAKSKFNEAAFLYYLGLMRFRYYNSVNPEYQASGDGALVASLKSVIGEPVNLYLRTDIDNFISVIKIVTDYYDKNDYAFYPKNKGLDKFNKQTKTYLELLADLEVNKSKYTEVWDNERKTMEKTINDITKSKEPTDKKSPKPKNRKK